MIKSLGTVKELWRYPVKSMRGELLTQCAVGKKGVAGDRGWAIRDERVNANEIRGGRNLPKLLDCYARYSSDPEKEPYPPALVKFPDGTELLSDAENINSRLSEHIGSPVSIWPLQPPENLDHYRRIPFDEEEVKKAFARLPGEPIPDLTQFPEILTEYTSEPGTYFDVYPIHILTTSTLNYLMEKNPSSRWVSQRFRPNFVIDTGNKAALVENEWIGKTLKIGEVELNCVGPTPRCAITAHSQGTDIEKDSKILRTIVKESNQNVGVYCEIKIAGIIKSGDAVNLVQ